MSSRTTLFSNSLDALASNKIKKKTKTKTDMCIVKEEIKLSLFMGNMISYIENPSDQPETPRSMKSLQGAWLMCNVSNLIAFLHTSNGQLESENLKYLFTITPPPKCLSINLTKYAQSLYQEN